jgi:hypothetical protein
METAPLKDIAIAVLGGSAAIAAVLLVFVTFLVGKADALPSETPNSVIQKYVRMARIGFVPLVVHVFTTAMAYAWLFTQDSWKLLILWKYGFWFGLVIFVLYAGAVLWML